MMTELAIDEEGEPFKVPPQVAGWRVRRAADGRGRPSLVYAKGKPLIARVDATHDDLLAVAGEGRYRLEAVDEYGHGVPDVPIACTGPLTLVPNEASEPEIGGELAVAGVPPQQSAGLFNLLCHVITLNTGMMEKTINQVGVFMSGAAELLNAAHNAGITTRPPPPPPVVVVPESYAQEQGDEAPPPSGTSDWISVLIKETVAAAVPLIFAKLPSLAGMPLEALVDWRKAVPTPPEAPEVPAPSAPAAPPPPSAPIWTPPPTAAPTHEAARRPVEHAGAAPSGAAPLGAVPAEAHTAPAASSPSTPDEAKAMVTAHVTQVWHALSPMEQARAAQLLARLTAPERAAWVNELAHITVPEAVERVRSVIHAQPPLNPQLPTARPPGDPS
jgi:hypothetical protein